MSIKGDIVWFMARLDSPPERLHAREVWHSETGASLLGTPAWSGEMRDLIEGSDRATRTTHGSTLCDHPLLEPMPADASTHERRTREAGCDVCYGSGRRPRTEEHFRRPMHAALQKLAGDRVPDGLPRYDTVLRQLALAQGDVTRTVDVLAVDWPAMGAPPVAVRHIAEALRRVKRVFRDEPPPRYLDGPRVQRSQAQLDAEAAA